MNYIIAIKTAIIIFPIIAFLITVPFMIMSYHKYGSIHPFKTLIIYTFILYLIVIYFLVIMPLPTKGEAIKNTGPSFNFTPFLFITEFINETSLVLTDFSTYLGALKEPCFYVVIFNIFMTIPFGIYLHYYFKCDIKKTIMYSFLLSLFFELTQGTGLYFIYPNPYRLCDIDDLILNTSGGILGYFISLLLKKFLPSREELDEEAREAGKKVSGLRRITIFGLDLFLYFIISIVISFLFNKYYVIYIIFFIYYIFIPVLLKKKTIAMKFLNVEMEYSGNWIIKNILRSLFLAFYYFYLPLGCFMILNFIINNYHLETITIFLYISYLLFLLLYYGIHFFFIIIKKKIYYDKLFGFQFKSTIIEESLL